MPGATPTGSSNYDAELFARNSEALKSLNNSDAAKEVKASQEAAAAGLPNEYYEEHDRERSRIFNNESARRIRDVLRPDLKDKD